jgi:hypothetical protein
MTAKMTISNVDQSTPELVVQSYLEARDRGDWQTIRSLVKPGDKDSEAGLDSIERFVKQGGRSETTNIKIDLVEESGSIARIQVRCHFKAYGKDDRVLLDYDTSELLSLVRLDSKWYFLGFGQAIPPGWIQPR